MTTQPTSQSVLREKTQLMSASEIERTLVRLAHQIIETNNGTDRLVLVGIKRRGVPLAQRLARIIERIENRPRSVALPIAAAALTRRSAGATSSPAWTTSSRLAERLRCATRSCKGPFQKARSRVWPTWRQRCGAYAKPKEC